MSKKIIATFIVCLFVVIVGVGVIVGLSTDNVDSAFISALTAVLVLVTAYYAIMTDRLFEATNRGVIVAEEQSKIARQQADLMLNEQYNAVAPLVSLALGAKSHHGDITIILINWLNAGKGPALNFRCWIEDKEHPSLKNYSINCEVIPVALTDKTSRGSIDFPMQRYELGQGYIRAQYESIFGITYESCLMFPTNIAPQFEWGRAKEVIRL